MHWRVMKHALASDEVVPCRVVANQGIDRKHEPTQHEFDTVVIGPE
jgi:hypothetical protein